MTIQQQLDEIAAEICNNYCKFNTKENEDELFEKHCDNCPLVNKL